MPKKNIPQDVSEEERKRIIVNACLSQFLANGLYKTTTRELSKSINLQSGGIYYYFKAKNEVVVACAEEASLRLENNLILPALRDINDPQLLVEHLFKRCDELAPTMRFLAQVCSEGEYREAMVPTLYRLCRRYRLYAEMFSNLLECTIEEVEPYVYMCITAMTSYMIFGEQLHIVPQMELVKNALAEFQRKLKTKKAKEPHRNDSKSN